MDRLAFYVVGGIIAAMLPVVIARAEENVRREDARTRGPVAEFDAGVIEQLPAEEVRFGYGVLADGLQKSIERSRYSATAGVALIAAQVAILFFLGDKEHRYQPKIALDALEVAFPIAIASVYTSFTLRDTPESRKFLRYLQPGPQRLRVKTMEEMVTSTEQNQRKAIFQELVLGVALLLTIGAIVAIVAAHGVHS